MSGGCRQGTSRPKRREAKRDPAIKRRATGGLEFADILLDQLLEAVFAEWAPEKETEAALDTDGSSQIVGRAEGRGDFDEPLVRAIEAARGVLAELRVSRPKDGARVTELLEQPLHERWCRIATDETLRSPDIVDLLLDRAKPIDCARGDGEEVSLLALHLVERLDPDASPTGLVGDLQCRALALRIKYLVHQRRLRAAELAALRSRELLLESSDPLVAFEAGLAMALLNWAEGRASSALKLLLDLRRLARELGELDKAAEMCLWGQVLMEDLGEAVLATFFKGWAERLLMEPQIASLLERVRAEHEWLGLGDADFTGKEEPEPVN